MPAVESSIEIRARADEVFDLSQDYDLRLRWDPFLRSLQLLDGAPEPAVGARTRVHARNGLRMTVEFVVFDRPRTVAVRMVRPSTFFREFAGSWRFRPLADDRTAATFRYTFRARPRALAWLIEPIARRVLLRDVRARLRGLKHGIETLGLRSNTASPAPDPQASGPVS